MGWFSSSSSASSSSAASPSVNPTDAPNRSQRQACWTARDAYFDCLTAAGAVKVPEEGTEEAKRICNVEREGYEGKCAKAWVDYFNKRRVLEARQRLTLEAAAQQGVTTATSDRDFQGRR